MRRSRPAGWLTSRGTFEFDWREQMARLSKRAKISEPEISTPQTDAFIGRDLILAHKRESEEIADTLTIGQGVQYYDGGLRYGTVHILPEADEKRYGQVCILSVTKRTVWVAGRDIRPLEK
jgi:hypothetical protein